MLVMEEGKDGRWSKRNFDGGNGNRSNLVNIILFPNVPFLYNNVINILVLCDQYYSITISTLQHHMIDILVPHNQHVFDIS